MINNTTRPGILSIIPYMKRISGNTLKNRHLCSIFPFVLIFPYFLGGNIGTGENIWYKDISEPWVRKGYSPAEPLERT